jgi:hypothetical protein
MFAKMRHGTLTMLFAMGLFSLLWPGQAWAQFRGRPPQPNSRQQFNGPRQANLLPALQRQQGSASQGACSSSNAMPPTSLSTITRSFPAGLQPGLQTALQPSNALLTALQQNGSASQSALLTALQQEQAALLTALQQTNALLTALQQNGSTSQSALLTALQQEQAALLAALQQTNTLLSALQQNSQLAPFQLQALRRQSGVLARQMQTAPTSGRR